MRALDHPSLNHRVEVISGVLESECRELMQAFYDNMWRGGLGTHEALRAAQLAMLRDNLAGPGGDPRPSTWGAFVLSGDWR